MQVNTKFLVCSLIYMGSLSANAVGSSSLANETVHVSILSVDQTKNERNITGRIIDGDTGEALIGVSILVKGASMGTVTDVDHLFLFAHYGQPIQINVKNAHRTVVSIRYRMISTN